MQNKTYHEIDLTKISFLITGGAGFIGCNLVDYLLRNNAGKVRVLDNLSNGYYKNIERFLNNKNFEFIEGDIRDFETCELAVRDIDYVSHQAALGSVPRSIKDPLTSNEVNINGFLNMLTAVKNEPRVKRMVYAASSSTYGDSKILPKVEGNEGTPLSPYAVTKLVNELYADVFSRVYGLHTLGLRYFNIFGPYQSSDNAYAAVIPLFIKAAKEGRAPVIFGDGLTSRDFTFVENAIQANIKGMLLEKELVKHEVVNIACGETHNLLQIWETLNDITKSNIEPTFSSERPGDVKASLANIDKAFELIGYKPQVYFKEGLKFTYEF
ncbi:SDR family oxidoreductase [Daejeonella sp.]|uniref:SDR family oxidoreductase n=1 Tax=Daejeonella sp. TaxID=2805397 RepID=UPI0025C5A1B6|nr:SDR family oxidoreductase [Daejeonella sp.]